MNEINYCTLAELSAQLRIPLSTLKVKMCHASKNGVPLPPRRRVGKGFLYDALAFRAWLWERGDALKRDFKFGASADKQDER